MPAVRSEDSARERAERCLELIAPPRDDEWVVTDVEDLRWCWGVHWVNRRAFESSTDSKDAYFGAGPLLIEKDTGRIAWTGSRLSASEWAALWLNGEQLKEEPAPAD